MQLNVLQLGCCLALLQVVLAYTDKELKDMFKETFGNIEKETINGEVTVDYGRVPTWLTGNFMRHACGAFGETSNMNDSLPNYIEHLFDCLQIGNKYHVENGDISFTQRWYETTVNEIYNTYGRQMNQSSVFMETAFSKVNKEMVDKWEAELSDKSRVSSVPDVSWWQIGNQAVAMTEVPIGVIIDNGDVSQKGWIKYNDDHLGIPDTPEYGFTNNPAHEQTEPDGTLWSTLVVTHFVSQTHLKLKRIVYKVSSDKVRHVVGAYHHQDADLSKCNGNEPYPDFSSRFGYMHSFCITKNYIILPETGYLHDPCVYRRYDKYVPFFKQGFHYEPNGLTRLLVMRKSDGEFVANITMSPFFVTHQLGAYEDGDVINMDMLTYDNANIYTKYTYLKNLDMPYTTDISRITINMTDFTARMRSLRTKDKDLAAFEMSNINHAYNGKKYTYGYMAMNFDRRERNAVTKLNVDTGEEMHYTFPEGLFVQEPNFVPHPNSSSEDDGVIVAQGIDGRKHKGFMVIIDAKTMELIAHVTAPDMTLLGLHSRFFPLSVGRKGISGTAASHSFNNIPVITILILLINNILQT